MKEEAMEDQGAHAITRSHHQHHPSFTHSSGGREDCWSEGGTATLIEAWGDRFLRLSRGNLRQKDWKEVADAVNGRQGGIKPRKTDIQCKNRIDTLKKKYKLEKSKPGPSEWPFYSRLDLLIGTSTNPNKRRLPLPIPLPLPPSFRKPPSVNFTIKHSKDNLNLNPNPNANANANANAAVYSGGSSSKSRLNSAGSSESSRGGLGDDRGDDFVFNGGIRKRRTSEREDSSSSDAVAIRELARAILNLGEIYERIESSKQDQMMELERQRMEFTKDLEFQRMQMFMEAQLQLEKMKRPKYASSTGYRGGTKLLLGLLSKSLESQVEITEEVVAGDSFRFTVLDDEDDMQVLHEKHHLRTSSRYLWKLKRGARIRKQAKYNRSHVLRDSIGLEGHLHPHYSRY